VTKRLRQPLVHILEHGQVLGNRQPGEVVEPCYGVVHPRVARGSTRPPHYRRAYAGLLIHGRRLSCGRRLDSGHRPGCGRWLSRDSRPGCGRWLSRDSRLGCCCRLSRDWRRTRCARRGFPRWKSHRPRSPSTPPGPSAAPGETLPSGTDEPGLPRAPEPGESVPRARPWPPGRKASIRLGPPCLTRRQGEMRCFMATAEECRLALENLTGRIAEMDQEDREAYLVDRVISCKLSDLGVTFVTKIGPDGASPVREANGSGPTGAPPCRGANGSAPPARARSPGKSDDLAATAPDPASIGRAWLTGRLKVEASIWDILRLRKIL